MEGRFDVIVIGAGPAGSMAAKECAKQGLITCLIEKHKIPRSKPCGGGITLKAIRLIDHKIPKSLIECYIKGFRVISPSLDSVEFHSNKIVGISTSREKFDAFLTALATNEGCQLIDSDQVTKISVLRNKVRCTLQSGRSIEGRIIIGADGTKGITARQTGIREKWNKERVGLCLETTIPLDEGRMKRINSDTFEMYSKNPLAYSWVLPKRSSISVGIGGVLADLYRPKMLLVNFCKTISKLKKITIPKSQFHAHLAPVGGFKRKIVADRVMLIGDAAGFIDPITGEGVYYAIKSGLLAAMACKEAIENEGWNASYLERHYSKVCDQAFGRDLKIALTWAYRIHNYFSVFFKVLKYYSGTAWEDLATGKTTYRALQKELIPRLMIYLPQLMGKFINQKLRNVRSR